MESKWHPNTNCLNKTTLLAKCLSSRNTQVDMPGPVSFVCPSFQINPIRKKIPIKAFEMWVVFPNMLWSSCCSMGWFKYSIVVVELFMFVCISFPNSVLHYGNDNSSNKHITILGGNTWVSLNLSKSDSKTRGGHLLPVCFMAALNTGAITSVVLLRMPFRLKVSPQLRSRAL